jgi:tetratricopeptide (TPR) repeat protein
MNPKQKDKILEKALTINTRRNLIVAIVLIIIAGIVALLLLRDTDKNSSYKKPGQLTLSLIKDKNFLNSIKLASQTEKETILIEAAKILRTEIHTITDNKHKDFVLDDFNNVNSIIAFILAIDSKNGHAIYFKGEVYRLLNDYDRFVEYFQLYLDIEASFGSRLPKVTNAQLCYESAYGYCEQRTAWISQLLANYYYKKGISEPDLKKKQDFFKIARIHVHDVRNHFPTGFDSSKTTKSTSALLRNLEKNISK